MNRAVLPTFDTSKKNTSGKEMYIKLSKDMTRYYNETILKNKAALEALRYYKFDGYSDLNKFLTRNLQSTLVVCAEGKKGKKSDDSSEESPAVKSAKKAYLKKTSAPLIKYVKQLDKIIAEAPTINETVHVYRGMGYDIISGTECENGKLYYTFDNFMSTSFTPSVSKRFTRGGCLYTLILDKGAKGIYIFFDASENLSSFQNVDVDHEAELLLPRGTKFEVVGLDFVHVPPQFYKFKDVPCIEKKFNFVKHYTLKFVGHASEKELKQALDLANDFVSFKMNVMTV